MLQSIIYWGAYAYFPFFVFAIWAGLKSPPAIKALLALSIIATSLLAYARFVEPRILVSHEETIILPGATQASPSIRIALFADTHLGRFGNAMPMRRIVERINAENVDATFIAGDFAYHPKREDIPEIYAPLEELNTPLFVVLGNHDVGFPGPDLTDPLIAALTGADATILQNQFHEFELRGQSIIFGGITDLWQNRMNFKFGDALPDGKPVILLTHNPDTASHIPDSLAYDLLLAGHTHGGQIRLPIVYKKAIPTDWPFDKELHTFPTDAGERLVYVTSGTGMVGLPMRLAMPPRIDILTIHIPE